MNKKYFDKYMNYSTRELEFESIKVYRLMGLYTILCLIILIIVNIILDDDLTVISFDILSLFILIYITNINMKKIDVIFGLKSYNKNIRTTYSYVAVECDCGDCEGCVNSNFYVDINSIK